MRGMLFNSALAVGAIMAAALVSIPLPAMGAKYATSESPFYRVGTLSQTLSRACQRGEFGQVKVGAYNIAFIGPTGRALTGIARSDWNLFDPKGLAEPRTTYHFYHQGYSDCRVFVAKDPPLRNRQ